MSPLLKTQHGDFVDPRLAVLYSVDPHDGRVPDTASVTIIMVNGFSTTVSVRDMRRALGIAKGALKAALEVA